MTTFQKPVGILLCHRSLRLPQIVVIALSLVALSAIVLADGPIIRVARISLVEGEVSRQRASDNSKDWFDVEVNMPLDESDQLYSGADGRAEIQLSGRNLVRIDKNTNLRFTKFNTSVIQLALPIGTATFRIESLDRRQFNVVDARDRSQDDPVYFEVDTPTVAITFLREGNYRVNVRDDGTTEVIVRRGHAEVYNQELGTITVKQGRRIIVEGRDNFYQITRLEDKDSWDRWNDRRDDELFARVSSYNSRHVPGAIPGAYDLDTYGDWVESPDYGWVWAPRGVDAGWAPYRHGCWRWYPSYGWTWIAHEPWGWVPYHYGRWAYWGSRWCWVPSVTFGSGIGYGWNWSPHLVAFFGWGGGNYRRGYNDGYWAGFRDGRGWLGWCPLAPGEAYYDHRTIVRNTTINNNYPRSVESLRNYNAPGGVSGMESRRFIEGRAMVHNNALTAPPRGAQRTEATIPMVVRSDDIKPPQVTASRTAVVERSAGARKLEAPVVMRRSVTESNIQGNPSRTPSRSVDDNGSRAVRDGVVLPSRMGSAGDTSTSPPNRINDGQIQRSDRPTRYADYQPVERIDPPQRPPEKRSTNESRSRVERGDSSGSSNSSNSSNSSGERSMPSRSANRPMRSEPAPGYSEPPPQRPVERREPAPPPRENRRSEPPPSRESMPSRNADRPSSPPPPPPPPPSQPRESPPPRQVERPQSESSPSRTPERTMPSRKPES